MSGSNAVYQPTTVTYDRNRDEFEMVYVPTFAHQSQSRRLLPTAVFVGGLMVGILALSFIIVGSGSGSDRVGIPSTAIPAAEEPSATSLQVSTGTSVLMTTETPVAVITPGGSPANSSHEHAAPSNETDVAGTSLAAPANDNATDSFLNATSTSTVATPIKNAKSPDGEPHATDGGDEKADGSNVLVGVGIPMLFISLGMIAFALHARGYLDSCLPPKRRTYAQQLSRGVVSDSGPFSSRQ